MSKAPLIPLALVLLLLAGGAFGAPLPDLWRVEIVSLDAIPVGNQPGFAIAQDGTAFATWDHWTNTDLHVYVAELRESVWVTTLLNASAHSPTVTVDADGNPHVLFENLYSSGTVHASRQDGVWAYELADPISAGFPDAEIDSAGRVHVIHDAWGDCIAYNVRISPGVWTREVPACSTLGTSAELAIGPDGSPHIVYMEHPSARLLYGHRANNAWSIEPIGWGGDAGIGVDANNVVHVSYVGDPQQLMYAQRSAGEWAIAAVPGSALPHSTSLALDSAGRPHISYEQYGLNDPNTGHQRYAARQADGSWINALIDPEGNSEAGIIRVDKTDTPRVLYYYFKDQITQGDLLLFDLRYAEPLTAIPSRLVT